MQSKGAIRFVAICLILASLWQLSFTLVTAIHNGKANKVAEKTVEEFQASAAFANVPDEE